MGAIWAIGEIVDGQPTNLTLEVAALTQALAGDTDGQAMVFLAGAGDEAAQAVAAMGPDVQLISTSRSDATGVAVAVADLVEHTHPDVVLIGATPDGKDTAGVLMALTDLPVLVAADAVSVTPAGLTVEMGTFGGRALTRSSFVEGRGIVLVRTGAAEAVPAAVAGSVRVLAVDATRSLPSVTTVERVAAPGAGPSIDDASIIVGAGRGVDGAAGITLVEDLASALDGAVGATRAAVDAGWIDFAQQIGQTGKTVKPDLYIAVGVSGAIQHRVGVQNVGAIIAIDKDREAPISEFADLVVIGDLFEVLPRLTSAIRTARQAR